MTVHKFDPKIVGAGFRFNTDEILEAAKGQDFEILVIMAEHPDGTLWLSSTANAGEALVLMKKAEKRIVFGEEV